MAPALLAERQALLFEQPDTRIGGFETVDTALRFSISFQCHPNQASPIATSSATPRKAFGMLRSLDEPQVVGLTSRPQ